jgi:hypothetical protein
MLWISLAHREGGPSHGVGHLRFCSLPLLRAKAPTSCFANRKHGMAAEQRTRLTFPCDHVLQAGLRHPFANRHINYTGLLVPQLGAFLSLTRPLHCRFLAAAHAWLVAGVRWQDRTPHPTALPPYAAVSFNRAPLAFPPRALAQRTRTRSHVPSHSNHLAATSSPPRAAIVHRRSPVSRLQLAKSVSAATVCEDEEGAAAVVHLSPPLYGN